MHSTRRLVRGDESRRLLAAHIQSQLRHVAGARSPCIACTGPALPWPSLPVFEPPNKCIASARISPPKAPHILCLPSAAPVFGSAGGAAPVPLTSPTRNGSHAGPMQGAEPQPPACPAPALLSSALRGSGITTNRQPESIQTVSRVRGCGRGPPGAARRGYGVDGQMRKRTRAQR